VESELLFSWKWFESFNSVYQKAFEESRSRNLVYMDVFDQALMRPSAHRAMVKDCLVRSEISSKVHVIELTHPRSIGVLRQYRKSGLDWSGM
jgi:hypothetical protein